MEKTPRDQYPRWVRGTPAHSLGHDAQPRAQALPRGRAESRQQLQGSFCRSGHTGTERGGLILGRCSARALAWWRGRGFSGWKPGGGGPPRRLIAGCHAGPPPHLPAPGGALCSRDTRLYGQLSHFPGAAGRVSARRSSTAPSTCHSPSSLRSETLK